jgi:hypothetical protein
VSEPTVSRRGFVQTTSAGIAATVAGRFLLPGPWPASKPLGPTNGIETVAIGSTDAVEHWELPLCCPTPANRRYCDCDACMRSLCLRG